MTTHFTSTLCLQKRSWVEPAQFVIRHSVTLPLLVSIGLLCHGPAAWSQENAPASDQPLASTVVVHSPAVAAVLESAPIAPHELLRGILALVDLGEAKLAAPFLTQLAEAKLGSADKAMLARQFGSPALMRLAFTDELLPQGRELALALLEAAHREARDPQRLAARVEQLGDAQPEVRHAALVDLQAASTGGVTACLSVLADAKRAELHAAVRAGLASLGPQAMGPFLATLATDDDNLKLQVIQVVGMLDGESQILAPYLLAPALTASSESLRLAAGDALLKLTGAQPTRGAAVQLVQAEIRRLLGGTGPFTPDYEGRVTLWQWDSRDRTCLERSIPVRDASVILAAHLAGDLVTLDPQCMAHRPLLLATRLEAARIEHGFHDPIVQSAPDVYRLAVISGPDAVESALVLALDQELVGAAIGAAEILGDIGAAAQLVTRPAPLVRATGHPSVDWSLRDPQPAPLVRAAGHADRRLRFAAIDTILKLDPLEPFHGSSVIPQALEFAATASQARQVVVGDPRGIEGQKLVALLNLQGFQAQSVTSGRRVLELAAGSADVELVLIDIEIDGPEVREVLYQLRRDWRTARVPVGLLVTAATAERGKQIASQHVLTAAFAKPVEPDGAESLVTQLSQLAAQSHVPVDERQLQAQQAQKWLAQLAVRRKENYEVLLRNDE